MKTDGGIRGLLAALILGGCAHPAAALRVRDYEGGEELYNRFTAGYPTAPAPNPSSGFIGRGYNWSGVGWNPFNPDQSAALISPLHLVTTRHHALAIGEPIRFQQPNGSLFEATLDSYEELFWSEHGTVYRSDVLVGRLAEPIPRATGIRPYPITPLSDSEPYVGSPLLMYGRSARIGTNVIAGLKSVTHHPEGNALTRTAYTAFLNQPGCAQGEPGDSGSPCFVPREGRLTLVGCNYAIDPAHSPERTYVALLSVHLDQICTIVDRDGYRLGPAPGADGRDGRLFLVAGALLVGGLLVAGRVLKKGAR